MIDFFKAKNQEITASLNGIYLHSSYNPTKEAERFAENLTINSYEKTIIIIEPALSYCASFIKKKYPEITLGAIRLCSEFESFNSELDFVIDHFNDNNTELIEKLTSLLGEEKLFSTAFIDWPPSIKAFNTIYLNTINSIKESLEKAKTLLITREYFEKKWFINSFNFYSYLKKPQLLKNTINKSILIIASGPSLKAALPIIKENQNKFFIICLSSAISFCLKNNIKVDLFFSTDGGYWAGEHLKRLQKNAVIGLTSEAFCPKKILEENKILALHYNDSLINQFLPDTILDKKLQAVRNGTVSGTALLFALNISNKNIYLAGLDMANTKGFQHSQPNEIEYNNELKDFRISTREERSYKSELSEGSLKIYLNWFQNQHFTENRCFRIIENSKNNLNSIKDLSILQFEEECKKIQLAADTSEQINYFQDFNFSLDEIKIKDSQLIIEKLNNIDFLRQLYPLTMLSLSHNPDNIELKKHLEDEKRKLIRKIQEINNA